MVVLSIAAHPDDETLGVGGTIARHAAEGEDVHVLILSDGVTSRHTKITEGVRTEIEQRKMRAREACELLGVSSVTFHSFPDNKFDDVPLLKIVQRVEKAIDSTSPDIIYTHHYGDLNIDHEVTSRAVMTAARPLPSSTIDRILAFQVPSSSEWSLPTSDNSFEPTSFVNIDTYLDAKLDAFKAYEKEARNPPHPRSFEHVKRVARSWGAKCGVPAAEAFELLLEVRR